jgi:ComF family protein
MTMRHAAALFSALCDAVFPRKCLGCGRFADQAPGAARGAVSDLLRPLQPYFCPQCLWGVVPLEPPFCTRCGVMFAGRAGESHVCGRCLEEPPPFRMARAAFVYDQSLIDVIHSFKYKGKSRLARPLGRLLLGAFNRFWDSERVDLILPVPLHPKRLRARGFNQSLLLAREWVRAGLSPAPVAAGLLKRAVATPPQTGLRRAERETNVRGAFTLRRAERVVDRAVLLIDDVITSGATVGACARLLLEHGAARVDVLALARTL